MTLSFLIYANKNAIYLEGFKKTKWTVMFYPKRYECIAFPNIILNRRHRMIQQMVISGFWNTSSTILCDFRVFKTIFSTNFLRFLTEFRFSSVWTECRLMLIVTREQMRLLFFFTIISYSFFSFAQFYLFNIFFFFFWFVGLNRDEFDRVQIQLGELYPHKMLKSKWSNIRAIIVLKLV